MLSRSVGLALITSVCWGIGCSAALPIVDRIPGIARLERDGQIVWVTRGSRGGAPVVLLDQQGATSRTAVGVGASFLITDGQTFSEQYRVLSIDDESITLERTFREFLDDRPGTVRTYGDVIRVSPYSPDGSQNWERDFFGRPVQPVQSTLPD